MEPAFVESAQMRRTFGEGGARIAWQRLPTRRLRKINMNFSIEKILYGTTSSSVTKDQRIGDKLNGNLHESCEPVSIKGKQSIIAVDGNRIVMV